MAVAIFFEFFYFKNHDFFFVIIHFNLITFNLLRTISQSDTQVRLDE